jgi:3-methyl-2-oxobutanoate hydroxymethyltransferase
MPGTQKCPLRWGGQYVVLRGDRVSAHTAGSPGRWTVEQEDCHARPRSRPVTVPGVRAAKRRDGHPALVMVTAYDAPGARIADDAGVDLILVGDSVANNVLGYENTLQVTLEDMAHHTAAVARAKPPPDRGRPAVDELPPRPGRHRAKRVPPSSGPGPRPSSWRGGQPGPDDRGAGGAEIPVMGHLGLTPQSVNAMGGYRVQGRDDAAAHALAVGAKAMVAAGCFAMVIEGVPENGGGVRHRVGRRAHHRHRCRSAL